MESDVPAHGRSRLARPGGDICFDDADLVPAWKRPAPVVLFQHGLAVTMDIWADWLPVLCNEFRLVRLDLRGHGGSRHADPGEALDLDLLMGDVLAVADAVGADRFHFVGESFGGTLGLALAAAQPARVLSLTACNTAHLGAGIANVRGVWRSLVEARGKAGWADEVMRGRLHPGAVAAPIAAWMREAHLACDTATLLSLADLLTRVDLAAALPRITMPALLLCPDGSPFISPAAMLGLRDGLPDAELQLFAHARHGLPASHAAACAALFRDFVARRG